MFVHSTCTQYMIHEHNLQTTLPERYLSEHASDEADGHFYLWKRGLGSSFVPSVDMAVTHKLPALTQVTRRKQNPRRLTSFPPTKFIIQTNESSWKSYSETTVGTSENWKLGALTQNTVRRTPRHGHECKWARTDTYDSLVNNRRVAPGLHTREKECILLQGLNTSTRRVFTAYTWTVVDYRSSNNMQYLDWTNVF